MLLFIAGMITGAIAIVGIIGFMVIVAEDQELREAALKKREREKKALRDIEDWYRSYY